ncbi:ATP-binding protein [Herbaspirillum sp. AP02]|uniref:AlbA family DNA-binding domain-containing protein n=1 Tax=unclassified Herbaspirillum TaxID=2624150 RepID=UPI0015DBB7FA|nr:MULTISPECIES: ATP-binding protein [unclassified Herbaspirillum]MBG7622103.1 ATP-binding protein [Herbaspirillum sp. AP02]NZD69122.1 ATP-binding protein [Herbaspirillum sp. AP21]
MTVTDDILNELRYRSESVDLDFKQAQYRFIGAGEQEKSELLKDILAIANSWREGTGYILIGFKDCTPNPADVTGISTDDHIDDAQLQQFVNGKVEPPLHFKYEERVFEEKIVAIISIPKQQRPFSVYAGYGKVRSNVVYVRRGSATVEASPAEIIKMSRAEGRPADSQISIELLNHQNESLSLTQNLRFLHFDELPEFSVPYTGRDITSILGTDSTTNFNYYRDLASYAALVLSSIQLRFKIRNQSNVSLRDLKLELHVTTPDVKYKFIEKTRFPDRPSMKRELGRHFRTPPPVNPRAFHIENRGKHQVCFARAESVLAGEDFISEPVLLRLQAQCEVTLEVRILAEQLPAPIIQTFTFTVTGDQEKHDTDTLLKLVQRGGR